MKLALAASTALLLLLAAAISVSAADSTDLTGKWTGTIEVKTPGGDTETNPVQADLHQNGKQVTGSAGGGDESDHMWPIKNGAFDGKKLTFEVTDPNGILYKVSLTSTAADRLEGTADWVAPDGTALQGKLAFHREAK